MASKLECGAAVTTMRVYPTCPPLPFVVIDLINLYAVAVDTTTKTMSIQSGGHLSGGEYGTLLRYAGLVADHVTDVAAIDPNGQFHNRQSLGEDVFWAIRGGGGNTFGIVAAWKVSLVTVPKIVTVTSVSKFIEQDGTHCLLKWQQIASTLPGELFIRVVAYKHTNTTSMSVMVTFNIFYIGSPGHAISLLEEHFPELGVTQGNLFEMSWARTTLYFTDFDNNQLLEQLLSRTPLVPRKNFKGKTDYVTTPISEFRLKGIWEWMLHEEIESAYLIFTPYGGIMVRIPETNIPFPHRQ
ncbi:Berberine bridge enzyme-like 15 [Linum perenne]